MRSDWLLRTHRLCIEDERDIIGEAVLSISSSTASWKINEKLSITQTRPYSIQQYFSAVKMLIFRRNFLTFFLFLLKTLIVGTR